MDSLIIAGAANNIDKKTFFNHVFSTTEESKAEFFNVFQYSFLAILPIVFLNKFIQTYIPDVDLEKSSLEIITEIFLQIFAMFFGIIIIHRIITFFPTYSGFKYDSFSLTNVILAFFIIIFSIQTKLGLKINILFSRTSNAFFGYNHDHKQDIDKHTLRKFNNHSSSQADFYDHSTNNHILPLPNTTSTTTTTPTTPTTPNNYNNDYFGPIPANSFSNFYNNF
jgi:hypothetical protein